MWPTAEWLGEQFLDERTTLIHRDGATVGGVEFVGGGNAEEVVDGEGQVFGQDGAVGGAFAVGVAAAQGLAALQAAAGQEDAEDARPVVAACRGV